MTNPTTTLTAPSRAAVGHRTTFAGVLRSERIKALSVRSTRWILGISLLTIVGLDALSPKTAGAAATGGPVPVPDVLSLGPIIGQWFIVALGALIITNEYATGQVRSTFAAVPSRGRVLAAKVVILTTLATAVAIAGQLLGAALAAANGGALRWSDPRLWQVVAGDTLAFDTIALVGLGLGLALRSTAATIVATLGLGYGTQLLHAIPTGWAQRIGVFTLNNLSNTVTASPAQLHELGTLPHAVVIAPGSAALLLTAWILVALGLGAWRLRHGSA